MSLSVCVCVSACGGGCVSPPHLLSSAFYQAVANPSSSSLHPSKPHSLSLKEILERVSVCVYMCTIFIILSNHTRGHNGFAWKTLLAEKPLLLFIKSELKVF